MSEQEKWAKQQNQANTGGGCVGLVFLVLVGGWVISLLFQH